MAGDREQLRRTRPSAATVQPTRSVSVADMYDLHIEEVYRFVHRRCRDHQLAEDITQETFLRALRTSADPASLSVGWLITVARNLLYDVMRRKDSYQTKLRLLGSVDSEEYVLQLVERLQVEDALKKLTLDQRLVLTLHYLDGLTVPAMAMHLDRSPKSIEGLLTRARRAFRAQLDDGSTDVMDITEGSSND